MEPADGSAPNYNALNGILKPKRFESIKPAGGSHHSGIKPAGVMTTTSRQRSLPYCSLATHGLRPAGLHCR